MSGNVTEEEDKKVATDMCDNEDGDKRVGVADETDGNKDSKDDGDKEETTTVEPPPKVQKVVDPNLPAFRATCHR